MTSTCRLFALLAAALILGVNAFGQTSEITGLITDPNGAAVPDAAITARNVDTGIDTGTVTNNQGYYTLPSLNPGITN